MPTTFFKQSLSFLFLAIFISIKVGGLHVLTHEDSNQFDDCAICHVLASSDHTLALLFENEDITFENQSFFIQQEVAVTYAFYFSTDFSSDDLVSRPPPAV